MAWVVWVACPWIFQSYSLSSTVLGLEEAGSPVFLTKEDSEEVPEQEGSLSSPGLGPWSSIIHLSQNMLSLLFFVSPFGSYAPSAR